MFLRRKIINIYISQILSTYEIFVLKIVKNCTSGWKRSTRLVPLLEKSAYLRFGRVVSERRRSRRRRSFAIAVERETAVEATGGAQARCADEIEDSRGKISRVIEALVVEYFLSNMVRMSLMLDTEFCVGFFGAMNGDSLFAMIGGGHDCPRLASDQTHT